MREEKHALVTFFFPMMAAILRARVRLRMGSRACQRSRTKVNANTLE